jgi:hypothetical protein
LGCSWAYFPQCSSFLILPGSMVPSSLVQQPTEYSDYKDFFDSRNLK